MELEQEVIFGGRFVFIPSESSLRDWQEWRRLGLLILPERRTISASSISQILRILSHPLRRKHRGTAVHKHKSAWIDIAEVFSGFMNINFDFLQLEISIDLFYFWQFKFSGKKKKKDVRLLKAITASNHGV